MLFSHRKLGTVWYSTNSFNYFVEYCCLPVTRHGTPEYPRTKWRFRVAKETSNWMGDFPSSHFWLLRQIRHHQIIAQMLRAGSLLNCLNGLHVQRSSLVVRFGYANGIAKVSSRHWWYQTDPTNGNGSKPAFFFGAKLVLPPSCKLVYNPHEHPLTSSIYLL